jgi:hypothetical protein
MIGLFDSKSCRKYINFVAILLVLCLPITIFVKFYELMIMVEQNILFAMIYNGNVPQYSCLSQDLDGLVLQRIFNE